MLHIISMTQVHKCAITVTKKAKDHENIKKKLIHKKIFGNLLIFAFCLRDWLGL